MAGLTFEEKQTISEFLDALKTWWNAELGSENDVNGKARIIRAIDRQPFNEGR